jgi:hypothetical protein
MRASMERRDVTKLQRSRDCRDLQQYLTSTNIPRETGAA